MYTKHLQQRSKVWDDGFLQYHVKSKKLSLFTSSSRCQPLEQKFNRTAPDLSPGETLRFNKFLVEIVSRRLEGKSSVKRDARSSSKNSQPSTPTQEFKKGLTTGINCAHKMPLSALPKVKNSGFPAKGRKPFICPQKVQVDNIDVRQNSSDEEIPEVKQTQNQHGQIQRQNAKPTLQELISGTGKRVSPQQVSITRRLHTEGQLLSEGEEDIFYMLKRRREADDKAGGQKLEIKQPEKKSAKKSDVAIEERSCSKKSKSKKSKKSKSSKKHKKHKKKKDKKRSKSGKSSANSEKMIEQTPLVEDIQANNVRRSKRFERFDFIAGDLMEGPVGSASDKSEESQPESDYSSSALDSESINGEVVNNMPLIETEEAKQAVTIQPMQDLTQHIRNLVGVEKPLTSQFQLPPRAALILTPTKPVIEVCQELMFDVDISKAASPKSSQDIDEDELKLQANTNACFDKLNKKRVLSAEDNVAIYESHHPQKTGLQNQISKINALDRLKIDQEQRLNQHNRAVKSFDQLLIDFLVQHDIHGHQSSSVLRNRDAYAGFYILAVIEMLKYAVKEDYDNSRTEINLIPIELEYIKPNKGKMNTNFANVKKRMVQRKKQNKKGKHVGYEDSSEEEKVESEHESESEESGAFYLRFKEAIPPLVRKDMMLEDLWLLMKRPLVTNQNLSDVSEMILVKNLWHSNNKQQKIKVSVLGEAEQVKYRVEQYKYSFKSVNLQSYRSLIENLIQFRERANPYVDSMLGIANSKSKFKTIKKCDPGLIEAIRSATCCGFKLNADQEFVLNEVTNWFKKRSEDGAKELAEDAQMEEDFDILGIEDALENSQVHTQEAKLSKHIDSNIVLVHGAFGCGKSYLLVAIIRFISTLLDQVNETETKILVCALTNVAVDRILLMLKDSGYTDFARVGSLKKIHKSLLTFSHHSGNQKKKSDTDALKDLQQMADDIKTQAGQKQLTKEQFDELQQIEQSMKQIRESTLQSRIDALASKRVVGATCAATEFEIMKNLQFKIVILDECSQMLEPQSLLPISKFNCRKLIAVGDPLQLPPIISFSFKEKRLQQQKLLETSQQKQANQISPHIPLFVRLQKAGQPSILLRTQYRCHPNIAQVANYLFYENYLLNGVKAEARKRLIKTFPPITFISAEKGLESKAEFSYRNYYEAKFIVALLNYLVNLVMRLKQGLPIDDGESSSDTEPTPEALEFEKANQPDYTIGVILTYKSQVSLIEQLILESNNDYLKGIQVSTVDAFQGAERDIIVVGCVRTRNLGFIEDCRRLNVAITRARRHLIVVGKESLLRRSTHWRYIIERSLDKNEELVGYKKVDDFVKMGGLFKQMMKEFQ